VGISDNLAEEMIMALRVGILTVSDRGSRGERVDTSGAAIREILASLETTVERYEVVPDEEEVVAARLREWADEAGLDLIITTGGTGLSPRDVTPEATLAVVERVVPGMAEAMRQEGLRHTPMAMLSRAVVGVRGRTLIVNLPGRERGVRENLAHLLPVLPHALAMLGGEPGDHPATGEGVERLQG
jgi:molybdenum cofactor synthesis domain-containing protein